MDRGSWIVDRGSAVIFDADSGLCLSYVRILSPVNEIWITDLSSALVGMLFCHQACRLLYYLGEINSGIHMYQFTFEPLHFYFGCGCGVAFEQKFRRIDGFGGKKARIGGFAYPY